MEAQNEKGIVEATEDFLAIPMMPIEQLKRLTAYVNDVKKALMVVGQDYIVDGKRQYTARSGFAKLAQGFGLSDDPAIIEELHTDEPNEYVYEYSIYKQRKTTTLRTDIMGFKAMVVVRNRAGRMATGEGACTVEELYLTNNLSPKWYHRCLATAKTRAYNRAVSNFVGSAEVSAEELGLVYPEEEGGGGPEGTAKPVEAKAEAVTIHLPAQLMTPSFNLKKVLREQGWEQGQVAAETWLSEAGVALLGNLEVKADTVKVAVGPARDKSFTTTQEKQIGTFLEVEGGFVCSSGQFWRLNKKDVMGVNP